MIVTFYCLRREVGSARLLDGRIIFDLPPDLTWLMAHAVLVKGRVVTAEEPAAWLAGLVASLRSPYLHAERLVPPRLVESRQRVA